MCSSTNAAGATAKASSYAVTSGINTRGTKPGRIEIGLSLAGMLPILLIFAVLWGTITPGGMKAFALGIQRQPQGVFSEQPAALASSLTYSTAHINPNRPVLAFYYMWYTPQTWCSCHMSDLPTTKYDSGKDATIEQQVTEAANAGITGFISSWWGPGSTTDKSFAKLLTHAAALQQRSGYHFDSTIYFESDSPALNSESKIVAGLRYLVAHYTSNANFFHWHGKPVLFFWNPLGNGRTMAMWASVRKQVDPHNALFWSAEGVNLNMLTVFDGIHLFSAGYWGLLNHDMAQVDKGFRAKLDGYNQAHHTQKAWAAGVEPGYNDTRVPGRKGTYIVPRNNGATYRTSWSAALASNPDWVTITSFNEWFEGAMIEPSIHYGDSYLKLTAQFTKQWHG